VLCGAAGIDVVGIFYQLACGNEILVQTLSRAFYHRDASRMQNTLYGYPGLRFKMKSPGAMPNCCAIM
jgi:hypothetical protein